MLKKETQPNKEKCIDKNDIVTLSYKLYDSKNNLVDNSYPEQPLILQYGKTNINKELEKKLKGKKVGDEIEIKQQLKTKAPTIEINNNDLEEEDIENLNEGQDLQLNISGKETLFVVEKIDTKKGSILLRYKNPYENETLTNKIKIEKIIKK